MNTASDLGQVNLDRVVESPQPRIRRHVRGIDFPYRSPQLLSLDRGWKFRLSAKVKRRQRGGGGRAGRSTAPFSITIGTGSAPVPLIPPFFQWKSFYRDGGIRLKRRDSATRVKRNAEWNSRLLVVRHCSPSRENKFFQKFFFLIFARSFSESFIRFRFGINSLFIHILYFRIFVPPCVVVFVLFTFWFLILYFAILFRFILYSFILCFIWFVNKKKLNLKIKGSLSTFFFFFQKIFRNIEFNLVCELQITNCRVKCVLDFR